MACAYYRRDYPRASRYYPDAEKDVCYLPDGAGYSPMTGLTTIVHDGYIRIPVLRWLLLFGRIPE